MIALAIAAVVVFFALVLFVLSLDLLRKTVHLRVVALPACEVCRPNGCALRRGSAACLRDSSALPG